MTPEQKHRYESAVHRIQTAIATTTDDREHKHLRVGIDTSKADMEGLVSLLIEKGVITPEEYCEAIVQANEREADRYENALSKRLGATVRTI